jgi:hypothetical protein
MSYTTSANQAFEIPFATLEKECPALINFLVFEDNLDDFHNTIIEGEGNTLIDNKIEAIKKHFKDKYDLDIDFDYRLLEEDSEEYDETPMLGAYCYCDNAVTYNPNFLKLGGKNSLWVSGG